MEIIKIAAFAAVFGMLTGCAANHPYTISKMSLDELKAVESHVLCRAYVKDRAPRIVRELQSRNEIPDREWDSIKAKKVFIGMSKLGAVCAWGYPTSINKTHTSGGTSEQWVYRSYGYYTSRASYLYIKSGVISAIQN